MADAEGAGEQVGVVASVLPSQPKSQMLDEDGCKYSP